MGFDDRMAIARDQLLAEGRSVTYGGTAITALWHQDTLLPGYYPDSAQDVMNGVLTVSAADVASPAFGAAVVIDGDTWAVVQIGQKGAMIDLQLERRAVRHFGQGHEVKR